ncbi:MAG: TonB-dependent receptor [Bacteroidetes bacterium]|jgi:hypothetical protein|nr:TonB-dependent receptor [Bacteroidota bacterium]
MGLRKAQWFKIALLTTIIFSGTLFAGVTGKISGKIVDKNDESPLVGASVIIEGSNLGAATDINGEYFIINIPPGNYTVRADYIGYREEQKTDVLVLIDKTIFINYELEAQTIQGEEILVSAYRPDVADPDLTATKQTYDIETIESLPGISDVGGIVNLQADVDGGHFRGGRAGEAAYLIAGVNIMNPLTGGKTFSPITIGLEQVEVYTSGFSAEYGNVQSGVVNMVPKEGWGQEWETRIEVSQTNDRYDHWGGSIYSREVNPYMDTLMNIDEWVDGIDPLTGGYLLDFSAISFEDKYVPQQKIGFPIPPPPTREDSLHTAMMMRALWLQLVRQMDLEYAAPDYRAEFSTGGKLSENSALFIAAQVNTNQTFIPTPSPDMDFQILGNLSHRINQGDKLSLMYNFNRDFENDITSNFARWFESALTVPKVIQKTQQFGVNWNHTSSKSTFMEMKLSHIATSQDQFNEVLQEDEFSQTYNNNSNWRFSKSPSGHTGGNLVTTRGNYHTSTTDFSWNISSQVNQRNLLKSGVGLKYYDIDVNQQSSLTNETSARWDDYQAYPFEGAIYLQDKMEYEGFIANLGLRYDFYNFNTEYFTNRYSPYRNPGFENGNPDAGSFYDEDRAAKSTTDFTNIIQPRIGFSFPISEKTVLHLNYGVFTQRPAFEYIFQSRFQMNTYPNFDRMGNAELEPEKTISYDMGIVRMLPFGLSLDLSAYNKNVSNLVQGAQYEDLDGNVYNSFDNREYADIHGIQIALDKKRGFIQANLRYNWESATGQASSPLGASDLVVHYENPNKVDKLRNPKDIFLDFNRLHKVVATLGFHTGKNAGIGFMGMHPLGGITFRATYKYMSGRPFTWDASGQGLRFNLRTPEEQNLTARFEKVLSVSANRITAFFEGYNLLNDKVWHYSRTFSDSPDNVYRERYVDETTDVLTETEFSPYLTNLTPYLYSNSPRSFRFGLKLDF